MSGKNALIIFVKNPARGKVKTRLAKTHGEQKAYDIYLELLNIARENFLDVHAEKIVFYSDYVDKDDMWENEIFLKELQKGVDLGERRKNSFQWAINKGYRSIILVGTDIPFLGKKEINVAFEKLKKHDVVIGPARDGGYYLVGLNKMYPALYQGISWSTENVFSRTIDKIKKLKLSYAILDVLNDVDHPPDLVEIERYKQSKQHS